jgi:hypothetical protein
MRDAGVREAMGRASRELAVAAFAEPRVIAETIAVYGRALGEPVSTLGLETAG